MAVHSSHHVAIEEIDFVPNVYEEAVELPIIQFGKKTGLLVVVVVTVVVIVVMTVVVLVVEVVVVVVVEVEVAA